VVPEIASTGHTVLYKKSRGPADMILFMMKSLRWLVKQERPMPKMMTRTHILIIDKWLLSFGYWLQMIDVLQCKCDYY
jgi:hypothetical protein